MGTTERLRNEPGPPRTEREEAAVLEKEQALETLFARRLSVLTGGAGTGKTSLLNVFLSEVERLEGRHPILLLAPTGKARVRLAPATGRNAMTIHQFLLRRGWLMPETFSLKADSEQGGYKATTVVVDECSMIPVNLLGTLLSSLDMGPLTRLVLVGDPYQLPPIGPGRSFVDVIEWLRDKHPESLAPLTVCMRTGDEDGAPLGESMGLALAGGYRGEAAGPADDEVLAGIAHGEVRGDIEVVFWQDRDDLRVKLKEKMRAVLGFGGGGLQRAKQVAMH